MANWISDVAEEVSAAVPHMSSSNAVVSIEEEEVVPSGSDVPSPQERNMSSQNLRRYDSLYLESRKLRGRDHSDDDKKKWSVILQLAFQSIGVVYGDIGTSPLYVYAGIFPEGIKHEDDVLGAMSLIFYTLTLLPVIKYVFIVLRANDNGDGGTFALYSLICRYAKVGLIPNAEMEDGEVSNYQLNLPNRRQKRASRIQSALENSHFAKVSLLFATMLGTAMVIGDGVLTPCISVLSANCGGIREAIPTTTEGIPAIIKHIPALQSMLVFVTIKSLPVSKVLADERFVFRRVEVKEIDVFRCVIRYGYTMYTPNMNCSRRFYSKDWKNSKVINEHCVEMMKMKSMRMDLDGLQKHGVVHLIGETELRIGF